MTQITIFHHRTVLEGFNQKLWKEEKSKCRIYSFDCNTTWTEITKADVKINANKEELVNLLLND